MARSGLVVAAGATPTTSARMLADKDAPQEARSPHEEIAFSPRPTDFDSGLWKSDAGSCCWERMRCRHRFRSTPSTSSYIASLARRVDDRVAGHADRPGTSLARCALSLGTVGGGGGASGNGGGVNRPTHYQAKELIVDASADGDGPSRLTIAETNAALSASTPPRRAVAGAGSDVLVLGGQRAAGMCIQTSQPACNACRPTSVLPLAPPVAPHCHLPPALTRAARVHARLLESGSGAGACAHACETLTVPSTAMLLACQPPDFGADHSAAPLSRRLLQHACATRVRARRRMCIYTCACTYAYPYAHMYSC